MGSSLIQFTCNICGRLNERLPEDFGRETPTCDGCRSSVRARAIVHMLSRELFGSDLILPNFPRVKAIRGTGLSDSFYDEQLETAFDYRNTFYHKEPKLDIVNLTPEHEGAYDFLISSEVFEHVPPPAETAFQNAFRVLKPNGVLLLTIPYTLDARSLEHFPELHDFGLAHLSGGMVLVNRTADGTMQVFEDLCFHGGPGSTLEIRRFNEAELRAVISRAGFESIKIYSEDYTPFGIVHRESWSLPIAVRKAPYSLPLGAAGEILDQWTQWLTRAHRLDLQCKELLGVRAQYEEFHKWATETIAGNERELEARGEWARGLDAQLEQRTQWAANLRQELDEHIALVSSLLAENRERTEWALRLDEEVKTLRARIDLLDRAKWTRAGRGLGVLR